MFINFLIKFSNLSFIKIPEVINSMQIKLNLDFSKANNDLLYLKLRKLQLDCDN